MRSSDWSSDLCSSDLMTIVERLLQGRFVNQAATRAVDDADALLGLGEILPAQNVARLLSKRRVQRDEVSAGEQFVQSRFFHAHLDRAFRGQERVIGHRSEEHTSELQSLMRSSYAVFCLKKKKKTKQSDY